MTDPDDLKTLLSPATGLAALPLEALHAALAEHIAALVLRAQAHILAPVESFEPQRPAFPTELRIRALTRSAADAALCLARLPRRTASGLKPAAPRRGAAPGAPSQKLLDLVDGVVAAQQAAGGDGMTPGLSLKEAYEDTDDRLAQALRRYEEEQAEEEAALVRAFIEMGTAQASEDEQTPAHDVRMPADGSMAADPLEPGRR